MTRWLLRAAAVAVGWTGAATAQPLTPAALANTGTAVAPNDGDVLLMRTTGQPERQLKVLKRSTFSDGESLVDVRDTTSGQTFTIPGKLADLLPRYAAGKTPPAAAPEPGIAPAAPVAPAVAPSLNPAPLPAPQPRQTLPPNPTPAPRPSETVWKPVAADTAPLPLVAPPTTPPALVPIGSAAVNPAAPVPAPPAQVAPTDRWKPIPLPPPPPMAPSPTPNPPGDDDGIVARGQMPDAPTRPATPRTYTWATAAPSPATERGGAADSPADGLSDIVRREMRPMADQLANALRPSVRVNAALGLADMRYSARPEVKAVLAKAAMSDPAAFVRTVCVRALARLGYNESGYVEYLRDTARGHTQAPEQLRLAALDALRVVTPRD